jgi:hypothetical protein
MKEEKERGRGEGERGEEKGEGERGEEKGEAREEEGERERAGEQIHKCLMAFSRNFFFAGCLDTLPLVVLGTL